MRGDSYKIIAPGGFSGVTVMGTKGLFIMKSLESNRVSFLGYILIGLLTVSAGDLSAQTTPPGTPPTTPQAPVVKIVSPTNGTTFSAPADIPITADVSDVG